MCKGTHFHQLFFSRSCLFIFTITLMLVNHSSYAGAKLFVNPQHVIFLDKQRSHEVTLSNLGDRTGVFQLQWVDYEMTPEGTLLPWQTDTYSPWSIQPFVRYSPRRVTLAPGESQIIKIAIKRNSKPEFDELFSHLIIRTINDNLEKTLASPINSEMQYSVSIETRMGIGIPVSWYRGKHQSKAALSVANIQNNSVQINIERLGANTSRGYLHVLQANNQGETISLADPSHIVIYPNLDMRSILLPLTNPLQQGKPFTVYYTEGIGSLDNVIGKTTVNL